MSRITTKFKTYISSVSIINNNVEKLALNIIFCSFAALAVLYILLLSNMVSNIVERRSLEASARTLASEVGDLELSYLSMSKNIDLDLAHTMGFRETKANFATRKSLGLRSASIPNIIPSRNDI